MLRGVGFEILDGGYVDSLGFLATLAFKAADDGSGAINVRALRFYDRVVFPLSRILDHLVGGFVGKNVYLIARKPN